MDSCLSPSGAPQTSAPLLPHLDSGLRLCSWHVPLPIPTPLPLPPHPWHPWVGAQREEGEGLGKRGQGPHSTPGPPTVPPPFPTVLHPLLVQSGPGMCPFPTSCWWERKLRQAPRGSGKLLGEGSGHRVNLHPRGLWCTWCYKVLDLSLSTTTCQPGLICNLGWEGALLSPSKTGPCPPLPPTPGPAAGGGPGRPGPRPEPHLHRCLPHPLLLLSPATAPHTPEPLPGHGLCHLELHCCPSRWLVMGSRAGVRCPGEVRGWVLSGWVGRGLSEEPQSHL